MSILGSAMFGWAEIGCVLVAAVLLSCGMVARLRSYRSLFWAGSVLMLISVVFPRQGNPLGQYLFVGPRGALRLPLELFEIAWWILGAWIVKSLLELILRRTIFPEDNEPHARRLFADLASALIYVVALVGILDTVLKEPISAVLATSGVLAIVLGLALQNTLADLFAGLAINIERPFAAGEWISATDGFDGQVMEINWRATRLRTGANDMIVIPNSMVAKTVVTNHSRMNEPYICTIRVKINHIVSPARVIEALQATAVACPGTAAGTAPTAYACEFDDMLITYELAFAVAHFTSTPGVQSDVIRSIAEKFQSMGIQIGTPPEDIRILQRDRGAEAKATVSVAATQPSSLHAMPTAHLSSD
jgi:small-conductance mechanosensitive channel